MLTDAEREQVRYHMGYLEVSPAASISWGIPSARQPLYIVELAMQNVMPVAEDRVRRILSTLETVECRLREAQERLAAISLGDLHLRENEPDMLEKEYVRWAARLADVIGAPLNPYSRRFQNWSAGGAGSIPVVG